MFYEGTDAIWDYLGITGAIYFSGAISVLLFGLYWKPASSTGAILSLLGGFTALACLCFSNLFSVAACKYPVTDLFDMQKIVSNNPLTIIP